jgi:D-alanyl-D-alanine carboxypeptidase/D-alanyl-D-alanine-endopeptidase (penicillin-binding protein 4)
MRAELAAAGIDMRGVTLADGSGLCYENRVPPRVLVGALRLADGSFRFGPELVAALPIAAADGTLEKRAEGAAHAVRAKTGLLTRVTSLSGFAQLGDGAEAVFSVIVNGYRGSDEAAMEALDRFVAELTPDPKPGRPAVLTGGADASPE